MDNTGYMISDGLIEHDVGDVTPTPNERLLQALVEIISERMNGEESGDTGTPDGFKRISMTLAHKLTDLEYGFRSLGSGGPGMDAARELRHALESLAGDNEKDGSLESADLTRLEDSCKRFRKSLINFIDMYYNKRLSILLSDMENQAKCLRDDTLETNDGKTKLARTMRQCLGELTVFLDKGVPMIKGSQSHITSKYLNMTTIAAFFSAVTATMIQFTYQVNTTPLDTVVNVLLIMSLVFSVASAAHSLLIMAWRQSCVRSPEFIQPHWARGWLIKGPMIYLTVSGVQFSTGLCLFAYSSNQSFVTRILVPVFGALHALALFAFSLWFAAEQWRFRKTAGVGRKATAGSALMWLMERFDRMVHPMNNRYKDNHDVQTSYPRARDVTIDMDRMSDPATPKSRPETLSSSVPSSRASLETHETENTDHSLPPSVTTPVSVPTGQRCSSPVLDSPTSIDDGDMFGIIVPENDHQDDVVPNPIGPLLDKAADPPTIINTENAPTRVISAHPSSNYDSTAQSIKKEQQTLSNPNSTRHHQSHARGESNNTHIPPMQVPETRAQPPHTRTKAASKRHAFLSRKIARRASIDELPREQSSGRARRDSIHSLSGVKTTDTGRIDLDSLRAYSAQILKEFNRANRASHRPKSPGPSTSAPSRQHQGRIAVIPKIILPDSHVSPVEVEFQGRSLKSLPSAMSRQVSSDTATSANSAGTPTRGPMFPPGIKFPEDNSQIEDEYRRLDTRQSRSRTISYPIMDDGDSPGRSSRRRDRRNSFDSVIRANRHHYTSRAVPPVKKPENIWLNSPRSKLVTPARKTTAASITTQELEHRQNPFL